MSPARAVILPSLDSWVPRLSAAQQLQGRGPAALLPLLHLLLPIPSRGFCPLVCSFWPVITPLVGQTADSAVQGRGRAVPLPHTPVSSDRYPVWPECSFSLAPSADPPRSWQRPGDRAQPAVTACEAISFQWQPILGLYQWWCHFSTKPFCSRSRWEPRAATILQEPWNGDTATLRTEAWGRRVAWGSSWPGTCCPHGSLGCKGGWVATRLGGITAPFWWK